MRRKILSILITIFTLCTCMFTLTACGEKEPPHTHAFNKQVIDSEYLASPATCETPAKYYYVCSCWAKGTETFEHDKALGHSYDDWVSNGNGTHRKVCANDSNHILTENCYGGTATETNRAVCEGCGSEYGDFMQHIHEYNQIKHIETAHWYECLCGATKGIEAHKGGEATCSKLAECSICGIEYGGFKEHKYNELKKSATKHWYECECGEKSGEENHKPGTSATETTDQKCTICDYIITPALGHVHTSNLTKVEAEPQSCTKEGNIEYYTCSCGKWFKNNTATTEITDKSSVVIEKDDHSYTKLKKSATEHWYECVCGDKDVTEAHKGGTATCTKLAECSVCGEEYGELEEHSYNELKYNEIEHWFECLCGDRTAPERHAPKSEWMFDENEHWKECSTEGCVYLFNVESHVLDSNNECEICDYTLEHEKHTHSVYFYDGNKKLIGEKPVETEDGFAPIVPYNVPQYHCYFYDNSAVKYIVRTFTGWKDENGNIVNVKDLEVKQDINLYAYYESLDFDEPVIAVIFDGTTNIEIDIYCSMKLYAVNFNIDYIVGNEYISLEDVIGLESKDASICITDESARYDYNNKVGKFSFAWANKEGVNVAETKNKLTRLYSITINSNTNQRINAFTIKEDATIVVGQQMEKTQTVSPKIVYFVK